MEDFGDTSVRTSAIKDMKCRPRRKRVQPTADFLSVVLQHKTYSLVKSCAAVDFNRPSIVRLITKENQGAVGLNSLGGHQ